MRNTIMLTNARVQSMFCLCRTSYRFSVSEPRGSTSTFCYIVNERLLGPSHEENQAMNKDLELLARIFLNHYQPFNKTLTKKAVSPKDASLLVLVSTFPIDDMNHVIDMTCVMSPLPLSRSLANK